MVKKTNKKTNKKLIKNKRRTKKRGGLFGFSTNADKDGDGNNYKYVYTFGYSTDTGQRCITIKQKKALLGNLFGVKKYTDEAELGKLYVGTIFKATKDRSMTARLLGSDKSGNKQNVLTGSSEFNKNKETYLSQFYANTGLKRAAKYGRMALSFGNTFATGRWPETGYYMVTDITSNNVKTSFKFARIYYFDKKEEENYFTGEPALSEDYSATQGNTAAFDLNSSQGNTAEFDLNSSKGKCSYSEQESCLIGLKTVTVQNKSKQIQQEEITNGNENFISNISFLGEDFDQTAKMINDSIKDKLIALQKKYRQAKDKVNTQV